MSKAYAVHLTRPRHLHHGVRYWLVFCFRRSLFCRWGGEEGKNHTAYRRVRMGPLVISQYEVKP